MGERSSYRSPEPSPEPSPERLPDLPLDRSLARSAAERREARAQALSLIGASFAYRADEPIDARAALSNINLSLEPGEMLAVLGPQGSGTSTLCRLAAGLLADHGLVSGRVEAAGEVAMLGDDPEAQLTGMTSFVDDEIRLPTRLTGSTRPVDVDGALEALGMRRLAGRRLDTLSGGERQLVALAGLMTLDPSLLVLDQPALSLDPSARVLLRDALRRFLRGGGAVLLAGHQHDELTAAADRVVFLQRGRIAGGAASAEVTQEMLARHGVWNTVDLAADAARIVKRNAGGADPESASELAAPAAAGVVPTAPGARPAPQRELEQRDPELCEPAQHEPEPERWEPLLSVRDMTVRREGFAVFEGLDFAVASGEVLAIIGANGAGKSTLLRAIGALLGASASTTGELMLRPSTPTLPAPEGSGQLQARVAPTHPRDTRTKLPRSHDAKGVVELGRLAAHERAQYVGWVGQDPGAQLSAATVRGELERAAPLASHRRRDRARLREERRRAVQAVLERVDLAESSEEHPYDLTPAQRKDLVIASALLLEPSVLLLDEPTLGRDLEGMRRLERIITDFTRSGGAVLLTTHDLRWAARVAARMMRLGN
ncbi:ATP-binding cassette domain-containing protein [Leucobacter sp. USHLN153]|uniref:ATP-binding cassette domain-containing protein n=1 Tax=Leucobacter sp. USHLN153 TaxID=3081268 RepID=UPI00301A3B81